MNTTSLVLIGVMGFLTTIVFLLDALKAYLDRASQIVIWYNVSGAFFAVISTLGVLQHVSACFKQCN